MENCSLALMYDRRIVLVQRDHDGVSEGGMRERSENSF
jgi:hypothetical protein